MQTYKSILAGLKQKQVPYRENLREGQFPNADTQTIIKSSNKQPEHRCNVIYLDEPKVDGSLSLYNSADVESRSV